MAVWSMICVVQGLFPLVVETVRPGFIAGPGKKISEASVAV